MRKHQYNFLAKETMEAPVIDGTAVNLGRTIRRRNNIYILQDASDSESSEGYTTHDITQTMIDDLYDEVTHKALKASRKASWLKLLAILCTMFIIVSGPVVGVLSIYGQCSCNAANYVASALGFIIGAVKLFQTTFTLDKRGVTLKWLSGQCRSLSRKVWLLKGVRQPPDVIRDRLDDYYAELDELEMQIYDSEVIPPEGKKRETITKHKEISEVPDNTSLWKRLGRRRPSNSSSSDNSSNV